MPEKPFCIFVVDDDALLRLVITDQLQGHGYQLHEFANGEECLAAMDLAPNLILLDIEMPGLSGIEVCRQIRADGNDDVQVMFVSAHDDLEILLTAFDAGGNDFIPKNAKKRRASAQGRFGHRSRAAKTATAIATVLRTKNRIYRYVQFGRNRHGIAVLTLIVSMRVVSAIG